MGEVEESNIIELDQLNIDDEIYRKNDNINNENNDLNLTTDKNHDDADKKSLGIIYSYITGLLNKSGLNQIEDMYANIMKVTNPYPTLESIANNFNNTSYIYVIENDHPYYTVLKGQLWNGWEYFSFKILVNGKYKNIVGVDKNALDSIIVMLYNELKKHQFIAEN
jgi:TPP-dependent indolepyruvate ferredoxin oxidoreductase alpha subunit